MLVFIFWFDSMVLNDLIVLLGMFVFVAITTKLAKIAPLVLFLFCLGVFCQTGYLFIAALFFGGNLSTLYSLLVMTLKVSVCSLASITVFSGLNPDRLATGLLYFGCPDQLSFSISYAFRILPILMEEFQNILLSYRLRGHSPSKNMAWESEIFYIPDKNYYIIFLSVNVKYCKTIKNNS